MSQDPFGIIAAADRGKACRALAAAFDRKTVSAIVPVSGGVSGASIFRVAIGGGYCILRIEGQVGPLRNPHQYISMRIAAKAGIAPRVLSLDEDARVAVMDCVQTQPLASYPGGAAGLARAVGELLSRLQACEPFPHLMAYPDIVARLWAHVCRTGLFAPGALDAATERLARIVQATSWHADALVSSHNDVLPRNLLFDGRRLWLVDWESAYRSDPLVDVATALDNFAPTRELEPVLLQAWRGVGAVDGSFGPRLAQVRALTRLYYAGVLFSASAAGNWRDPDVDVSAPTPGEFARAIRGGQLKPDTFETSHVLGKMYLASFLSDVPAPGLPPPLSAFAITGPQ